MGFVPRTVGEGGGGVSVSCRHRDFQPVVTGCSVRGEFAGGSVGSLGL